ncbi:MAG TPA: hypothetical protein VHW23_19270 [Kofleriaceae bacterium]|nr:hypothetical protein [Kofleriaceae bacterium]
MVATAPAKLQEIPRRVWRPTCSEDDVAADSDRLVEDTGRRPSVKRAAGRFRVNTAAAGGL